MQKKITIGNIMVTMFFRRELATIPGPEVKLEKVMIGQRQQEKKLILHRSEILLAKNIMELFLQNKLSGIESSYFSIIPISTGTDKIIRYDVKLLFDNREIILDKLACKNILSVIQKCPILY